MKARLKSGEIVDVVQKAPFEGLFVTNDGVEYNVFDIDFTAIEDEYETQNPISPLRELTNIMQGMDACRQMRVQSDIDERAYWREIRGDIFLELLRKGWATSITKIADATDIAVQSLAKDDKEMFKNGKENKV